MPADARTLTSSSSSKSMSDEFCSKYDGTGNSIVAAIRNTKVRVNHTILRAAERGGEGGAGSARERGGVRDRAREQIERADGCSCQRGSRDQMNAQMLSGAYGRDTTSRGGAAKDYRNSMRVVVCVHGCVCVRAGV